MHSTCWTWRSCATSSARSGSARQNDLALSSQAQGDLTGAAEHLREGVSQSAEARDEPSVAYYLEALATVAIRQDNPECAVHLLAAAAFLATSGCERHGPVLDDAFHHDG